MYLLLSDLAHDRVVALAQERHHHRSVARSDGRGLRRGAARVFARISLASAAIVRRLDACIADDLVRPLTTRPDGA